MPGDGRSLSPRSAKSQGQDGQNGQDGQDGQNGQDGQDGQDLCMTQQLLQCYSMASLAFPMSVGSARGEDAFKLAIVVAQHEKTVIRRSRISRLVEILSSWMKGI